MDFLFLKIKAEFEINKKGILSKETKRQTYYV